MKPKIKKKKKIKKKRSRRQEKKESASQAKLSGNIAIARIGGERSASMD